MTSLVSRDDHKSEVWSQTLLHPELTDSITITLPVSPSLTINTDHRLCQHQLPPYSSINIPRWETDRDNGQDMSLMSYNNSSTVHINTIETFGSWH